MALRTVFPTVSNDYAFVLTNTLINTQDKNQLATLINNLINASDIPKALNAFCNIAKIVDMQSLDNIFSIATNIKKPDDLSHFFTLLSQINIQALNEQLNHDFYHPENYRSVFEKTAIKSWAVIDKIKEIWHIIINFLFDHQNLLPLIDILKMTSIDTIKQLDTSSLLNRAVDTKNIELVTLVCSYGITDNDNQALKRAVAMNHPELTGVLLKLAHSPLTIAIFRDALQTRNHALINAFEEHGIWQFLWSENATEVIRDLIAFHPTLSHTMKDEAIKEVFQKRSPKEWKETLALLKTHLSLEEHRMTVDYTTYRVPPLHYASQSHHTFCFSQLLKEGVTISSCDEAGRNILYSHLHRPRQLRGYHENDTKRLSEILSHLHTIPFDINAPIPCIDDDKNTALSPLILAIENYRWDLARVLLTSPHIRINDQDEHGKTPLDRAVRVYKRQYQKYKNSQQDFCIDKVLNNEFTSFLKEMLKKGAHSALLNIQDPYAMDIPLIVAILEASKPAKGVLPHAPPLTEVVLRCLENYTPTVFQELTAAHFAQLKLSGLDFHTQNRKNWTFLHLLLNKLDDCLRYTKEDKKEIMRRAANIAQLFLLEGIDPARRDVYNQLAIDYIRSDGFYGSYESDLKQLLTPLFLTYTTLSSTNRECIAKINDAMHKIKMDNTLSPPLRYAKLLVLNHYRLSLFNNNPDNISEHIAILNEEKNTLTTLIKDFSNLDYFPQDQVTFDERLCQKTCFSILAKQEKREGLFILPQTNEQILIESFVSPEKTKAAILA